MLKNNSMKQLLEALPKDHQPPTPLPYSSSQNATSSESTAQNSSLFPKNHSFSAGYTVADTGVKGLLHFIYKARTTGQYTQPDYSHPYIDPHNLERFFSLYRFIYCFIHTPGRNLKIYFHTGDHEAILVWVGKIATLCYRNYFN